MRRSPVWGLTGPVRPVDAVLLPESGFAWQLCGSALILPPSLQQGAANVLQQVPCAVLLLDTRQPGVKRGVASQQVAADAAAHCPAAAAAQAAAEQETESEAAAEMAEYWQGRSYALPVRSCWHEKCFGRCEEKLSAGSGC